MTSLYPGFPESVSGAVIASGGIGLQHHAGDSISGNVIASGGVGLVHLANNAASGTRVSLEYPVSYTGSPSARNTAYQFGTGATNTGSVLWVVFGTAFAAAPAVVCTSNGAIGNVAGSPVVAGSFRAFSTNASEQFSWIAAGSGRV